MVGIPVKLTVSSDYSGSRWDLLQFELLSAPIGMTLQMAGKGYAYLNWVPAETDMGKSYNIHIRVTDGALIDEDNLSITVSKEVQLETAVSAHTISVVDQNSGLQGLSIHFTDSTVDMRKVNFSIVDLHSIHKLPTHYSVNSHIFMVRAESKKEVTVRIPVKHLGLPDSSNLGTHIVRVVSLGEGMHGFYGWQSSGLGCYVDIYGERIVEFKFPRIGNRLNYFTIEAVEKIQVVEEPKGSITLLTAERGHVLVRNPCGR